MFKKSNNPKVEELTKSVKDRQCSLSRLRVIKSELLNEKGNPRRFCCWCTEGELFHGNQRYCSRDCADSAEAHMYPQKELGLKFLLMKQDYKCAHCQFDYKPFLEEMIVNDKKRYGGVWEIEQLPWHYFKRLKNHVSRDKNPEVDHILAISKGGVSLGLENHQVICYTCHKIKSKVDNSGPRKKT